jgi:hypothetical protein
LRFDGNEQKTSKNKNKNNKNKNKNKKNKKHEGEGRISVALSFGEKIGRDVGARLALAAFFSPGAWGTSVADGVARLRANEKDQRKRREQEKSEERQNAKRRNANKSKKRRDGLTCRGLRSLKARAGRGLRRLEEGGMAERRANLG